MAAFAAVLNSLGRFLSPPKHPTRLVSARRVHLFAALGAGGLSGLVFLAGYYLTLGLLPSAFAYPTTEFPVSAWAHRLDLAQFVGSLLDPPLPSPLTWIIGVVALFGAFTSFGVVYAILLAWSLQPSDPAKGAGFGVALFVGLAGTLTIANGLHPAIMRNTLPDPGLFLIGWTSWATLHALGLHVVYGSLLGALYRRYSAQS